ncbi:hypothetical protein [Motiliproteus sp. SC1-56]|uniref:hypothetical protein n=1 Tax=Motiliproteus sp. SC1-56 TaxID=2799565 RepID=UPI001F5E28E6|nr:hypothetical protein [Motiliproteus sp. SC1-56]
MTTPERHPDIEIYIKAHPLVRIEQWLRARFDTVEPAGSTKQGVRFYLSWQGQRLPALVVEKAAGNFTSLWFDSDQTPWDRDIDCAREAAAEFECEVRCIASGWKEGDEPDEWWSITPSEEKTILWRG